MIEELVKDMALILIDEKGMSMMDALDYIFRSMFGQREMLK